MANEFDPYREALVVEKVFHWPNSVGHYPVEVRKKTEEELDRSPQTAKELAYVRLPTGFRREITVTEEDVRRILGVDAATSPTPDASWQSKTREGDSAL